MTQSEQHGKYYEVNGVKMRLSIVSNNVYNMQVLRIGEGAVNQTRPQSQPEVKQAASTQAYVTHETDLNNSSTAAEPVVYEVPDQPSLTSETPVNNNLTSTPEESATVARQRVDEAYGPDEGYKANPERI